MYVFKPLCREGKKKSETEKATELLFSTVQSSKNNSGCVCTKELCLEANQLT